MYKPRVLKATFFVFGVFCSFVLPLTKSGALDEKTFGSATAKLDLVLKGQPSNLLSQRALVLVPGTLNSLIPGSPNPFENTQGTPYFSQIILDTLRHEFASVHVIKDLRWTGDLRINGEKVLREIQDWYQSEFPRADVPITMIAHSAGGFYSLWAAHVNEQNRYNYSYLPIEKILMLSTPLQGAELADLAFQSAQTAQFIEKSLAKLGPCFDFRGLLQLTSSHAQQFLRQIRLPAKIKIMSVVGVQGRPPLVGNPFSAEFLPPPLVATDLLLARPSDGIVSEQSTRNDNILIEDTEGRPLQVEVVRDFAIHLDHIEQILDVFYLGVLGIHNLEFVRRGQQDLFQRLSRL